MWKRITLDVPDDLKDAIVGELSGNGAAGVWEDDDAAPGQSRLTAYFDPAADLDAIRREVDSLFSRSQLQAPQFVSGTIEDQDWTEEWKKSYTSFPIADQFFVIPSWSASTCPRDRFAIHIDPGQAFGTGTHETTQLTMEALERWVEPHHVILDLGAGSGILAIAASLLGAKEVLACDIDPVAIHVADANIKRNSKGEVWTFCGSVDAVSPEAVDLLLCNLTEDLIVELFPELHRVLRPRGLAIFSGILSEQREDVFEVINKFGYTVHEEMMRGEWLALVAQKPLRQLPQPHGG
jgi:ribosomal protein L11 methyltransferase